MKLLPLMAAAAQRALELASGMPPLARPEVLTPAGFRNLAQDRRREAKAAKDAAYAELVKTSHAQIILEHIHPRWLREVVKSNMDLGYPVTEADIAEWKAQGPNVMFR